LAIRPAICGKSVAHKKNLDKRARACLAANWLEGQPLKPTKRLAARMFQVSEPLVAFALRLSVEQRDPIIEGQDQTTKFLARRNPVGNGHAVNGNGISDAELEALVLEVGIERLLDVLVTVDQHRTA
jgi:hypothetical protein